MIGCEEGKQETGRWKHHIRKILNSNTLRRNMDLGGCEASRRREPAMVRRREHRRGVHIHIAVAAVVGVVLEAHDEAAGGDASGIRYEWE